MKKIIVWFVNIFLCHIFYRVKYINLENIQKQEQYIIAPNHSHILDPVWIYPKVKNLNIIAKSELFENKILGWFLKKFGAFPIKRGQKDARSLIYAIKILKKDKKSRLLIFPEGGILKEKERGKRITDSAIYISAKTNIPIVPVYITENPKLFSSIKMVFGEVTNPDSQVLKDKDFLKEKSKNLLEKIYSLKNLS